MEQDYLQKLQELRELFPKYDLEYDELQREINCLYKYFIYAQCHIDNINVKNMIEVYNSIDYVMQFLLENDFQRLDPQCNAYTNIKFNIRTWINGNGYYIRESGSYRLYSTDGFIRRIKELLDIETSFKKVLND